MRITIKGLTASTITFNTLGIILRGDSKNPTLYPNSIARNIDIKNDEQLSEVNGLVNAKLISIEVEGDASKEAKKNSANETKRIDTIEDYRKENIEESDDEISDAPSKIKSSKKKTSSKKKSSKKKSSKKASQSKKVETIKKAKEQKDNDDLGPSYVMTPSGAVEKNMVRSSAGEMEESDKTKASIEALKKLEKEESYVEPEEIDESKLDISERMGSTAIVSTGNKNLKVKMENSVIPEAKQVRDADIKFIDEQGVDVSDAFIDESESEDDSSFLEI